jgi:hypothetical protein
LAAALRTDRSASRILAWSTAACRAAGGASVGVGWGSTASGIVRVSPVGGATGRSGACATVVSSLRAPGSSSRPTGSLTSSPEITSASGPAFTIGPTGSVITAVSVAIAEPLS